MLICQNCKRPWEVTHQCSAELPLSTKYELAIKIIILQNEVISLESQGYNTASTCHEIKILNAKIAELKRAIRCP